MQRLVDTKANKVDTETLMYQMELLHKMTTSLATLFMEASRQNVLTEHQTEMSKEQQQNKLLE